MTREHINHRADIYSRVTDKIIAELDRAVRPWTQPWQSTSPSQTVTRPLRHNGEPYSGINVLLLWSEAIARGFSSSTWMTYRQALELGEAVRKGETGTTVVFASSIIRTETVEHGDDVERSIPFIKAYTVFNTDQIKGLDGRHQANVDLSDPFDRIGQAGRFFANTGALIRHGGSCAYYAAAKDYIQMPLLDSFVDEASYVAVLSHEMTHWTSAAGRLDRDLSRYAKDRTERAREELIAELGSAFLCADLGITPELEPRPDHASYIDGWLNVLRGDKRAIFQAAAHAQRAADYLHYLQPRIITGEDEEDEEEAA
ncbi:zincin-like metallopeptidase domain-containing protein [Rhizobium sp. 2MFCol3.1]|uniref:ArdC family protein n=1 Tax=Rhizobium sp. 2MFCol3.1 TaxID=1246459 RepID=UPI000364E74A|nr:zincin-like metallopeptidase domain-containing protein [Rhizobium sp. 2MFCol3.1]